MPQDIVFEILSREAHEGAPDITMETSLDELGIDSLHAITILYELEEELNIEIPNELIETIRSVGDILNSIDQLRRNTNPAC